MTYKQLAHAILAMNEEAQECDVTVYDVNEDEYLPLSLVEFAQNNDVLDDGHPILVINAEEE